MKHTLEEVKKMVDEECLCCEEHPGVDVKEIISDLVGEFEKLKEERDVLLKIVKSTGNVIGKFKGL